MAVEDAFDAATSWCSPSPCPRVLETDGLGSTCPSRYAGIIKRVADRGLGPSGEFC